MDDLISRQAAIDALIRKGKPVNNGDGTMTITLMSDGVIKETLEALPSAQPKIIRCMECKYYGEGLPGIDAGMICRAMSLNFKEDFYCAFAERREDDGSGE